jgi:hypothetical protein
LTCQLDPPVAVVVRAVAEISSRGETPSKGDPQKKERRTTNEPAT